MKRCVCVAVIAACCALAPARAADLGRPAPFLAGPYSWAGFYLGGNIGYGASDATVGVTAGGVAFQTSQSLDGVIGGIQAGYNWQAGVLVLGVEADAQLSSQQHRIVTTVGGATLSADSSIPWLGTLRARAGIAIDQWLVYATGGVAVSEIKTTGAATIGGSTTSVTISDPKLAWTLGAGIETALWGSNWTGRIEYLHVDAIDITSSVLGLTTRNTASNDIVRIGVNYRFGGGR